MRIAELCEPHRFRIAEGSIPGPAPGEVQVRVEAVGICGSDMHNFIEGSVGDTPTPYPMVLGHEPAGIVVEAGAGVTGWKPGDRAALEPAIYCHQCEFCLSGRHNICAKIRFRSSPPDPGFFLQYVNLPTVNLLPLPAAMSLQEATLFEPLGIVLHSMKFVALRPSETAAVFGAGPIGLMTIILLKMCGARRVWAVEPVAHRREMAKAASADAVLDSGPEAARQILRDTGGRGVDVAVDCAGKAESLDWSFDVTRNGGRVVLTAIYPGAYVPFQASTVRRKELAIYNVRRSNHDSQTALGVLRDFPARFAPIITHTLPLGKIQSAFEMLETYSDGVGKVVLTPAS